MNEPRDHVFNAEVIAADDALLAAEQPFVCGRGAEALQALVRKVHAEHAAALLKILDPFFRWTPHVARTSPELAAQAQAAIFWAKVPEVRVLSPADWMAQDVDACSMDVRRLEASAAKFFELLDQRTQARRVRHESILDQPVEFFAWLGHSFADIMSSREFGAFKESLFRDFTVVFGRQHGRLAFELLMPLLCQSCMFVLRNMPEAAKAFEPLQQLWLAGTPSMGIDHDVRLLVLAEGAN